MSPSDGSEWRVLEQMPLKLRPREKVKWVLLGQHRLWGYGDDTQDLNPPCFPPNLSHLVQRFCSPVTSQAQSPAANCQCSFFQMTPATPTAPKHPSQPSCTQRRRVPHTLQVSARRSRLLHGAMWKDTASSVPTSVVQML